MILEGYVRDKNGASIANAAVELKNDDFITIYRTESNDSGYYKFDLPAGRYPFLVAVKDYAEKYLEHWCQDIQLDQNMSLDVSFDTLEVYGLHVFSVKGAGNSLMAYFRPMSLMRFQRGEQDIAPIDITITAIIDGKESPVMVANTVKEFAEGRELSAYLIQVETTETDGAWSKFEIQIRDKDNHYGAATIFNVRN